MFDKEFIEQLNAEYMPLWVSSAIDAFYEVRRREISKRQKHNTKWTYIMYDAESEMCKIGISSNPYRREREMIPFRPQARLFALHVDNIEKELHERFSDKCYAGEWYKLTEEDLNDLITEGFRFSPNSFGDDFDKNQLYVVQPEELGNKNHSWQKRWHEEYQDLIDLHKELGARNKKATIKEANKRGLRTPSGFPWSYNFGLIVFSFYEEKGGKYL